MTKRIDLSSIDWDGLRANAGNIARKVASKGGSEAGGALGAFIGRISGPAIVPSSSISGRTLLSVIAIMTFLACLTLGSVLLIRQSAQSWASEVSTEVTIQVLPTQGVDTEEALSVARNIASSADGIISADILNWTSTKRLLEPWLGEDLAIDDLPIPRLIILQIDGENPPDFRKLQLEIKAAVPSAQLDDHRAWVDRLEAMANSTVIIGLVIFILMLSATCLAAIFATQGALAGNREVVEVLHFVGARDDFIAREFQRHFFRQGFLGSIVGGVGAMIVFLCLGLWMSNSQGTPQADQTAAFFGTFSLSFSGYLGIILVSFAIALLTALTARFAALNHLKRVYLAKLSEH